MLSELPEPAIVVIVLDDVLYDVFVVVGFGIVVLEPDPVMAGVVLGAVGLDMVDVVEPSPVMAGVVLGAVEKGIVVLEPDPVMAGVVLGAVEKGIVVLEPAPVMAGVVLGSVELGFVDISNPSFTDVYPKYMHTIIKTINEINKIKLICLFENIIFYFFAR